MRTELQNQWKQSTTNKEFKRAIEHDGPRSAFGEFREFVSDVRNNHRPTSDEITMEWGITTSTFRACCSFHNITIGPPTEYLLDIVRAAYNAGRSIAWCQTAFRLNFNTVRDAVQQLIPAPFSPTRDDIKSWYARRHTLSDVSVQFGVSLFAVKTAIKRVGVSYDLSLLRDEIVECVDRGVRPREICGSFNVARATLLKYLRQWNVEYTDRHKSLFAQQDEQARAAAGIKGAKIITALGEERLNGSVDAIRPLAEQQYSVRQISTRLGISEGTVKKALKFASIPHKSKEQYLADCSVQSYQKWMRQPRTGYDYSLVTSEDWRAADKKISIICKNHGIFTQNWVNHFSLGAGCPKCANVGPSAQENEIAEFVRSLGVEVVQSDNTTLGLGKKQLDIFIPAHRLAIEFNGIYWHSSTDGSGKGKHVEKTQRCEELGIQLLQINSDEWVDPIKREIWKSVIQAKLGLIHERIGARTTNVVDVDRCVARAFLAENHLQGSINGHHIGLKVNDRLVSVLTYGKSRFESDTTEIFRFCSSRNTVVVGGASKLIVALKRRTNQSIVSYANRRWSVGGVYTSCSFTRVGTTPPNYWYVRSGAPLLSRIQCQRHKLPALLGNSFDPSLGEQENMLTAGYRILYDCGNIKFVDHHTS